MRLKEVPKTEYNYIHTSVGGNDECYTHRYAVEPLLEFLEPFRTKIIWCPFDTEESEFVKVLTENGFRVVFSHIDNGQDFFRYEPEEWDVIISNPPFTCKKDTVKRILSFGKPFAVILPLNWLNDKAPMQLFKEKDLQLLCFEERMTFKNQPQNKQINFSSAYFCWNFLPKQIIIRDFKSRNQLKLLSGGAIPVMNKFELKKTDKEKYKQVTIFDALEGVKGDE